MLESNKPTRIGDLLMERGIISRAQLLQALDLQQARHLLRGADAPKGWHNEVGEILIELGFITREQLKKNLARQNRLRKTTLAFTLVAPLFTMACGGGGGGANASTPNTGNSNTVPSVVVTQSSRTPDVTQSSNSSKSATPPQSPASGSSSSKPANSSASSMMQSSLQNSKSSIQSSKSSTQSSKSSAQTSKASSSATSEPIQGPVVLYWTAPSRRENGATMDITELSGYEVRYKLRSKPDYKYINIPGGFTDAYYFEYLKGDYQFEIAAIDSNGMYSRFVPINPVN